MPNHSEIYQETCTKMLHSDAVGRVEQHFESNYDYHETFVGQRMWCWGLDIFRQCATQCNDSRVGVNLSEQ